MNIFNQEGIWMDADVALLIIKDEKVKIDDLNEKTQIGSLGFFEYPFENKKKGPARNWTLNLKFALHCKSYKEINIFIVWICRIEINNFARIHHV
jgi:hypothetical protein